MTRLAMLGDSDTCVGIMARNSEEWVVAWLASVIIHRALIAIAHNLDPNQPTQSYSKEMSPC